MSPPIRGAGTAARLKGALAGGGLTMVATDHAVFNKTQKRLGRHDFRQGCILPCDGVAAVACCAGAPAQLLLPAALLLRSWQSEGRMRSGWRRFALVDAT